MTFAKRSDIVVFGGPGNSPQILFLSAFEETKRRTHLTLSTTESGGTPCRRVPTEPGTSTGSLKSRIAPLMMLHVSINLLQCGSGRSSTILRKPKLWNSRVRILCWAIRFIIRLSRPATFRVLGLRLEDNLIEEDDMVTFCG